MRLVVAVALAAIFCLPAGATATTRSRGATFAAVHAAPEPVAFRSHVGLGRVRGRSYGFGGVSRRSGHSLLRRAVKTAIWLYILHLFVSHGGLSILLWIVIIAMVISLVRRRRRRYAY